MADLDAELLALAGDDSSGEEISMPTTSITAKATSSPSIADAPVAKINDTAASKSNVATKGTAKLNGNAPKAKKARKDDSEEEGEA